LFSIYFFSYLEYFKAVSLDGKPASTFAANAHLFAINLEIFPLNFGIEF